MRRVRQLSVLLAVIVTVAAPLSEGRAATGAAGRLYFQRGNYIYAANADGSNAHQVTRTSVRRQSACATLTLKTTRNVRVRARKTSECVRRSVRNVESAYLTLVALEEGERCVAEGCCTRCAARRALLMTASHCLRIAFRAYPLGHQRQVRTLELSAGSAHLARNTGASRVE